jgi:hypothetical protein
MPPFTTVLVAAVAVIVVVILVLAPFWLPWPLRLRWIVISSMGLDSARLGVPPQISLEEVTIVDVFVGPEGAVRVVDGADRIEELSLSGVPIDAQAQLRHWSATGIPLIKMTHPNGEVVLQGPTDAVAGLRAFGVQAGPR